MHGKDLYFTSLNITSALRQLMILVNSPSPWAHLKSHFSGTTSLKNGHCTAGPVCPDAAPIPRKRSHWNANKHGGQHMHLPLCSVKYLTKLNSGIMFSPLKNYLLVLAALFVLFYGRDNAEQGGAANTCIRSPSTKLDDPQRICVELGLYFH